MRRILYVIALILITALPAAAQEDDFTTYHKGNVTFDYPAGWSQGFVDDQIIIIADSDELLNQIIDGNFDMQSGHTGIAILTSSYLEQEFDIDPDAEFKDQAMLIVEGLSSLDLPLSAPERLQPIREMDAYLAVGGDETNQVRLVLLDTEEGVIGYAILAASGEVSEAEAIYQKLEATLAYTEPAAIADLKPDETYTTETGMSFDYPSQWFAINDSGLLVLTNRLDVFSADLPKPGDIAVLMIDGEMFSETFGQELDTENLEVMMQSFIGSLGEDVEFNQPKPVELGDNSGLRADAIVEAELRVMALGIETENRFAIVMGVTDLETMTAYETLLLDIAATVK